MIRTHEIHIRAHHPESAASRRLEVKRTRLARLGRWIFRLPLLSTLRPTARRAYSVTEPAGRLTAHHHPQQQPTADCTSIGLLSANLWHDWPRRKDIASRLETFVRLVDEHQVDILMLQEVSRTADLRVDSWLSDRLGMSCLYARANGHAEGIGFEEGLAIFSRFPMESPYLQELGCKLNPFVRRIALGAQVETPCGQLLAFSVHLGLPPRQNACQLDNLHGWVNQVAAGHTALVGGDFNTPESSPQIHRAKSGWLDTFRHLNPDEPGATHMIRWPWGNPLHQSRLDYIFMHAGKARWKVLEARHIEEPGMPHSDHQAVLVRVIPED